MLISKQWLSKKIPPEISCILGLFVVTRITLTFIGVASRILFEGFKTDYWSLGLWGIWDSRWYLDIAANGYPTQLILGQTSYAFFPLYPALIKGLGVVIGDSYLAGIIISNVCLIIACIFLYKLALLHLKEKCTALRSVKCLFLFPSAFILSGVFSESLFLALLLICFYHSKKNRWLLVGIFGFFLSTTKSIGTFMVLPLLFEYLKMGEFRFKNIKPNILFIFLLPAGTLAFMAYSYYLSGNFFAYFHAKQSGWGFGLFNPIQTLYFSLISRSELLILNALFAMISLFLLILTYKKIEFSYWLAGVLLISVPLIAGEASMAGVARFTMMAFPLYMSVGWIGRETNRDLTITLFFALLQGALMVFWSAGLWHL